MRSRRTGPSRSKSDTLSRSTRSRRHTSSSGYPSAWTGRSSYRICLRRRPGGSITIITSSQFVEQRLCLFEVLCFEAFREPPIDRGEQVAGCGAVALVAPQPRKAHRGAQFPELGLLLLGDAE